jgi:hypothetical protein
MPIDLELNTLLSVLALSDATKAAVAKGFPTCEHLEDLFLELAADKAKVEAMLWHIVDESIVSDIDIRRIMFVFDWCMMNIVDPNFYWSNFTRSVYVADKQARAFLNHAPSASTPVAQSTASVVSTIDFSSGVFTADAQRPATPAVPGTVATLNPPKLWTSPLACATVRALRTLIPADWGTQTDEEIMDTLYDEHEAIADFHQAGVLRQKEMNGYLALSRRPSSRRPRTLLYRLCIRSNSMQLQLRRLLQTYSIRHNVEKSFLQDIPITFLAGPPSLAHK